MLNNKNICYVMVPQVGVNDDEAELVDWNIKDFHEVSIGAVIATLETTKTTFELKAEEQGYLIYLSELEDMVKVNEPVAAIVPDLETGKGLQKEFLNKKKSKKAKNEVGGKNIATKKALDLAEKHNINITDINLSDGSIIRESNVQKYINSQKKNKSKSIDFKINSNRIPVIIYGAGQGGNTVKESLELGGKFSPVCFIDDNADKITDSPFPVLHSESLNELYVKGITSIVIALTPGSLRLKMYHKLKGFGFDFINVVSPNASISPSARIGLGNHIKSGAIIETNTKIGDFCIIDNSVVIAHDNFIENGCHLAPGVSLGSNIHISENTVIGIGCSISTGVSVGKNCIVSVGSSITSDIEDYSIMEGVPAKQIGKTK
jgi:sugar O-acyltransferase (sialic acid O-acetyltransferase NeuD family)